MSTTWTKIINGKETKFLLTENSDKRVFLSSENIDVFPCSRRGRSKDNTLAYDPEARLNTERTNRISTAINGFTDSFVEHFSAEEYADESTGKVIDPNTLIFVLAGYRAEVRNFDPSTIAEKLDVANNDKIYAHLSLHTDISLMAKDYYTEILYRQSTEANDANSLDVNNFFVGISFTNNPNCVDLFDIDSDGDLDTLPHYNLPIFNVAKSDNIYSYELVQTSLLPKIEHGETEDSIKINGNLVIADPNNVSTPTLKVNTITSDSAEVKIDKPLKVDSTLDVLSGKATLHKGLDVKNGLAVEGLTSLDNSLEVFGTTTLKQSLAVDGESALSGGLTVDSGDTVLKKLSAEATDVDSLTVEGTTYLKGTAQIDGEATFYNKLLVKSGDTTRARIDSSEISFDLPVKVNDTLYVKRTTSTGPAARVEGSLEVHEGISTNTINVNTLQSVDTIKTDKAEGLLITSTATSPERTLKVEGKTYITDSVETPTLDVKTIKNTATDSTGAVSIDDALTVSGNLSLNSDKAVNTDKLNVKNIKSRAENGTITVESPLEVTGKTTLKGEVQIDKPTTIYNSLTISGDNNTLSTPTLKVNKVTSTSNTVAVDKSLTVGQYINVGSPNPSTTTPGDIAASNNIFAENQIQAKQFIKAPTIYQTDEGIEKVVPFIDLVEQSGSWQLRINKVNKIEN